MTVMLFLDPATACGFAVGALEEGKFNGTIGEWDLSLSKFETWGMKPMKLERELEKLWLATGFVHVGYEYSRVMMSSDQAHLHGAFVAAIQKFCIQKGINCEAVSPNTLKKFFTGSGRASKAMMQAEAVKRGHMVDTDNEADAIAGWHWLQAQHVVPAVFAAASVNEAAE